MTPASYDSDMTHIESWTISLRPSPGDVWPELRHNGTVIQPDLILVFIEPGRTPHVSGSGIRRKRDGSPGSLRMNAPWYTPDDIPAWAAAMAADAVRRHGLGGQILHDAVPFNGTVRDVRGKPCVRARAGSYPLTAACTACASQIQCADGTTGWVHSAGLPDWIRVGP